MENLNKLELELLNRISDKYPIVKSHIPLLKVKSRQVTGVGMYVNFGYTVDIVNKLDILNSSLSTNEIIQIDGLRNGLNYEVDITDGKINFIEIVSNGESWDGFITNYSFLPF